MVDCFLIAGVDVVPGIATAAGEVAVAVGVATTGEVATGGVDTFFKTWVRGWREGFGSDDAASLELPCFML